MATAVEIAAELVELKADYAAIRVAMRAILGGAQSYTLDTSQTRQTVTRADLGSLRLLRQNLLLEIANMEASISGGRTIRVNPAW